MGMPGRSPGRSGWRCPSTNAATGRTAISRPRSGIPTLDGLGCPGAGAHASHEHILWQDLAPRAALLAGLLETLGRD
jgi:glutamate carboxypeptidase